MKDRYAAFRYEIEGNYNRYKLAIAIREKANQLSGFGKYIYLSISYNLRMNYINQTFLSVKK